MKRTMSLTILVAILQILFIVSGCTPAAQQAPSAEPVKQQAAPIVIKQSLVTPATHTYTTLCQAYNDRIEKVTEGRVKIELYSSSSLCPAADELSATRSGSIDSAVTVFSYITGQVPFFTFATLPWVSPPNYKDIIPFYQESLPVVEKAVEKYNVKVLYFIVTPDAYCLDTKKEVRTPADVKGLKIRGSGGAVDELIQNWGASVVTLPLSESYTAIQRGIVDGSVNTFPSLAGYKLNEVAPYICDLKIGMNGWIVYINKDKWDLISSADQKAILDLTPDFVLEMAYANDWVTNNIRESFPELGFISYTPTADEMKLWKQGAQDIWDNYAKSSPEAQQQVEIIKKYGGGP